MDDCRVEKISLILIIIAGVFTVHYAIPRHLDILPDKEIKSQLQCPTVDKIQLFSQNCIK